MGDAHPPAPAERTAVAPILTVVIPTRDRGDLASRTVASILNGTEPNIRLIVVDQSAANDTETALTPYAADPRFHYIRSASTGISAARNEGVAHSRSPLIAHTDDDCEALPDWCERLIDAFARHPEAELLFGEVIAEEGAAAQGGFVPSYHVPFERVIVGLKRKTETEGIGACMAYRRRLWEELGGFDELLGVGTRFGSAEDVDFAIRTLAAGHAVLETPMAGVIHYGFRTWEEGRPLLARYLHGIGGACAKQLRLQGPVFLLVMGKLALRWAFSEPVANFSHRPSRRLRLGAFLRGFGSGLRLGIEGSFFRKAHEPDTVAAAAASEAAGSRSAGL